MEHKILSKTGTMNYLFDLYKKSLRKLKQSKRYSEGEILNGIIMLHYCLEFQINEFFRDWFLFCIPETAEIQSFLHERIDKIEFLQKVTFFLYTNDQTKDSNINKKSLIKRIMNFNHARNTIFHGNELNYSYEDSDSGKIHKGPSFNDANLEKQISEYEKILVDFKNFAKHSSSFFNKGNDDRIDSILKSIYMDM